MAKKRKKTTSSGNTFSPKNYLKEKARTMPIDRCIVNESWKETGLADLVVTRRQPSGKFIMAVFLVDVFCLGVKNALWEINQEEDDIGELLSSFSFAGSGMIPIEYAFAHNLVYGSIAYAEELGFSPHKDFQLARYVLEEDDEDIEEIDIEFGRDGKPCFIPGPHDNVKRILQILERTVGKGNFEFRMEPE